MGFHKPQCFVGCPTDRGQDVGGDCVFGFVRLFNSLEQMLAELREAGGELFDVLAAGRDTQRVFRQLRGFHCHSQCPVNTCTELSRPFREFIGVRGGFFRHSVEEFVHRYEIGPANIPMRLLRMAVEIDCAREKLIGQACHSTANIDW